MIGADAMADVDPIAPTSLDESPPAKSARPASARHEDTAERHLAELLRNLPVGRELADPATDSDEEMLLGKDGGSGEAEDQYLAKHLREIREENGPGGSSSIVSLDSIEDDLPFLDRYLVLEILGQGGMGTVFKAYDQVLRRVVAVKLLHGAIAEKHGPRLVREAQALAQISHPNVVQVFDFGVSDRQAFVAMELIEGQTLREWQDSVPRPSWVDCVRIYIQVGRGLAAIHERGLTHRDFKPDNCVVDDDEQQPRMIDFGLVGAVAKNEPLPQPLVTGDRDREQDSQDWSPDYFATEQGVVMGTPAYMPPEQMQAKPADARSDQFSFCVALYEAVYGELPFEGDSFAERAVAVQTGKVRPEPRHSRVPPQLREALLRGLASEPAKRWPSMSHLIAALEASPFPALMPLRVPLTIIVIWLAISGGLGAMLRCGLNFQ